MKTWSVSSAGCDHKMRKMLCEDYAESGTKNGMTYIIVADGAGSLENSREGARIAAKAVAAYISENFEKLYNEEIARIKYFISSHILFSLKKNAMGRDVHTFGSTIVFLGIKNEKYILFHLGDGAILAGEKDDYDFISKPMNGETKRHTWLTTTIDAYKYCRADKGKALSDVFVVMSDGMYDMFANKNHGMTLWEKVWMDCRQEMHAMMMLQTDDCSISVMIKE